MSAAKKRDRLIRTFQIEARGSFATVYHALKSTVPIDGVLKEEDVVRNIRAIVSKTNER